MAEISFWEKHEKEGWYIVSIDGKRTHIQLLTDESKELFHKEFPDAKLTQSDFEGNEKELNLTEKLYEFETRELERLRRLEETGE